MVGFITLWTIINKQIRRKAQETHCSETQTDNMNTQRDQTMLGLGVDREFVPREENEESINKS